MGKKLLLLFLLLLLTNKTVSAQEWLLQAPNTFPKFFSSNTDNDKILNDFFYRHFSAMVGPNARTGDQQTEWREWDALSTTWIDTNVNKVMSNGCNVLNSSCNSGAPCGVCENIDYNYWLKKNLLEVNMEDNGQVWTYWNWGKDWPCAPDCGVWHPTNNTAFVIASGRFFKWTSDVGFLRNQIPRMRRALRFLQIDLHGDEKNLMENTMVGYDGLTTPGHGKTSNYWDVLPFGYRDANLTLYYYKALREMADIEEYVEKNQNSGFINNPFGETSTSYRRKAEMVKNYASVYFWNDPSWAGGNSGKNFSKGRLMATVDSEGGGHDYGFVFLNLEALYYGLLNDTQSRAVLSWITGDGKNEFPSDDSRGADIYRYVFAPRVSTKNNKTWYTPWWLDLKMRSAGGNTTFFDYVENGGVIFYLSFYDMMGRVRYLGADNGYRRLSEILAWYKDTWNKGGYRKVYHAGDFGLQGCGKSGSLGIDCEFSETTMVPLAFLYGFLGIEARVDGLHVDPKLPSELSFIGVDNLYYQGKLYKITVSRAVSQVTLSNVGGKSEIVIPAGMSYLLPFSGMNVIPTPTPTIVPTPTPDLRLRYLGKGWNYLTVSGDEGSDCVKTLKQDGLWKIIDSDTRSRYFKCVQGISY